MPSRSSARPPPRRCVSSSGGRRKTPVNEWRGRRDNGRAFLSDAKALRDLADEGSNGIPIMSLAIVGRKDATQYGHRQGTLDEARQLVEQCERFAEWAERMLLGP